MYYQQGGVPYYYESDNFLHDGDRVCRDLSFCYTELVS